MSATSFRMAHARACCAAVLVCTLGHPGIALAQSEANPPASGAPTGLPQAPASTQGKTAGLPRSTPAPSPSGSPVSSPFGGQAKPSGLTTLASSPSKSAKQVKAAPAKRAAFDQQLLSVLNQPGGLTSDEAARQAAARSLDAEARKQDIAAADAEIDRTFYNNLPRLSLTAQYQRLSTQPAGSFGATDTGVSLVGTTDAQGPLDPNAPLVGIPISEFTEGFSFDVPLNQFFLNAGLVVPVSDYLLSVSASIEVAEQAKEAARLNEAAARLNAAANARLAYYNWVRSELEAVVAEQSLKQAQARLGTLDRNFGAGRVAQVDVLSGRSFVATSELLVRRARTGASIAKQQLAQQMRLPQQRFTIGEDPLAPFAQAKEAKDLDQLYQEALRQRLELRALISTAYAISKGVEVTEANQWPRVEAFGNLTAANPNQRIIPLEPVWRATWDVGIRIVWTPNNLKTASSQAQALKSDQRKTELQKKALEEALRTEILSAYRALSDATLSIETANAGMSAAKAAYDSRARLFQFGRSTTLQLVDAQTTLLRAKLDLINSHIAQRVARVQLDHAVGRDAVGIP